MPRLCNSCERILPRTSYTANQWSLPAYISRCASCVHGHEIDVPTEGVSSGRYNNAISCTITNWWFREGTFRVVSKGHYLKGERAGQACVVKEFKSGAVFEDDYFTLDIKAVNKALEIVRFFNQLGVVTKPVEINVASVWTGFRGTDVEDEKVLVEPYIKNYQKFNSNTGWKDETTDWGLVMQALSHFSYHISRGNYVLCDLQGGIYQREVVLSDPVIMSQTREYGVTDLGSKGISSFFSQHRCNRYCRNHWEKPSNPRQYFPVMEGSHMMRRTVPTDRFRPSFRG